MTDSIRPRTKDERLAYMHGYASAIKDTSEHGIETARGHLRLMVEIEGPELIEKLREEAQ